MHACGNDILFQDEMVVVSQNGYIESTTIGSISRLRKSGPKELAAQEVTEFRSCSGALQWLAGVSRLDVASGESSAVLQPDNRPARPGLFAHQVLLADDRCWDCVCGPYDLKSQGTIIVSYTDSFFANAPI